MTIRKSGHRVGVPLADSAKAKLRTDRYRTCAKCGMQRERIVCADPPVCRSCWSKHRRTLPEYRDKYLRKTYGLTLTEAEGILASQGGGCAICSDKLDLMGKTWLGGIAVDHDHATGKVRGLLCHPCNVSIGHLKDSASRLDRAQRYLQQNEAEIDQSATLFFPVIMTRAKRIKIGPHSRIDSMCKLEGGEGLEIGAYVHVASLAHVGVGGGVTVLEDYSAVASGGKLISGSNQTDAPSMSASAPRDMQRQAVSFCKLSRYACVLTNAVVLPGVTLHEGAVLAAGGVATRDIPAWEIWGGVPARFMAKREVQP